MSPTMSTLLGDWITDDGLPADGQILVTPRATAPGTAATIAAVPVPFPLVDGAVSAEVVSNADNPTLQYLITEQITGQPVVSYVITPVPGTVDLRTASRGDPTQPVDLYLLASQAGAPGGVATLGEDGILTAAQRPPSPTTTRTTMVTFGSANQSAPGLALALQGLQATVRAMQVLPRTPTRYRLRIANVDAQNGTNLGTPMTVLSAWVGAPGFDYAAANQRWLGNLTAAPTSIPVGSGVVPVSGAVDLVTPWTTNAGEITAGVPFVLSLGVAVGTGGGGVVKSDCYGGMQYGSTSADQAGIAAPASGWNFAGFCPDVRLEAEWSATSGERVVLVVGASGESGYTPGDLSGAPQALNNPPEAWPAVWSHRQGHHVVNAGLNGSDTAAWTDPGSRAWTRFPGVVPDVGVIGTMASNDLSAGTPATISTLITNFEAIATNLRALGAADIYACTVPPRGFTGDAETTRLAYNQFLLALPAGIRGVFGFDLALRDPTNLSSMLADYRSTDGVHPTRGGHQVLGREPDLR